MRFHADLHIHSKYSRATSRDLDLEHLAAWACRKGITVVGTGDFTHPAWRAELKAKLVPAEPGLFRLREEIAREALRDLPAACRMDVRFMLSVEISTIYKKGERTRKIHHLIYAPDFDTADRFSERLGRIGNISSDGRPILGLDSRHLLEITLESGPDAYLVPAHIWTPWFAVLGSQSGFDSIVECYGDLSDHIFAVETGLSSDPPMNWRLSMLDRYRLVSNSDAHSPGKLGREATTFDTDVDYYAIRRALETGAGFVGTVEFFPEEGKYHLDGHRKCGVRLTPAETLAHGARCPACGQPLTIGVQHRAESLADRAEGCAPPATAGGVSNFVPLPEMLAEIAQSGPASKAVERRYDRVVSTLGSELWILGEAPIEDIARAESPLLAEAITRLRAGTVIREAGYDGEYGVIKLFKEGELKRLHAGSDGLFGAAAPSRRRAAKASAGGDGAPVAVAPAAAESTPATPPIAPSAPPSAHETQSDLWAAADAATDAPLAPAPASAPASAPAVSLLAGLDDEQRRAAEVETGPLLIIAGPGSGKTRTVTHRLAHLIAARGVPASACLAITFTRRAAAEMRERLAHLLPAAIASDVALHTFHSLGLAILREQAAAAGLDRGFRIATEADRVAALMTTMAVSERRAGSLLRAISKAKRSGAAAGADARPAAEALDADLAAALAAYQRGLDLRGCVDFDDLVGRALHLLETHAEIAAAYRDRFRWISVDEFQDVDDQQYRLLACLAPADGNLCAIGDPNQAIYGFRGADASCFERFARDYPSATTVALTRNYRSTGTIVSAAAQVMASADDTPLLAQVVREMHERIEIQTTPTERAEAEFVVQTIERMLGGHSLFSIDSGRAIGTSSSSLGFGDFAVLFRTGAQAAALVEAFARSGMPFKKHAHEPLAADPAVQALLQELDRLDALDAAAAQADASPRALDAQLRRAAANLADDGCFTDATAAPAAASPTSTEPAASALPATEAALPTPKTSAAAEADIDADADAPAEPTAVSPIDIAARETALFRLLALAAACDHDRARFADALALATEADFWDPRADRVSLLTLHAAKGLEFPIVFITGLENGLLPLTWGDAEDEAAAAEERRLFYVGMTRAKDRLLLSRATQRLWRGRLHALDPSPFLADIEQELVKHQRTAPPPRKKREEQLRLL